MVKMIRFALFVILLLVLSQASFASSATAVADNTLQSSHIIYVDQTAVGANNGRSWANAYTDLQTALAAATAGDELWVAAGIYKPVAPANPANPSVAERSVSFQLQTGVALYGGFTGRETARDQRDWQANPTILSGDIDNNDTNSGGVITDPAHIVGGNSYQVVNGSGVGETAVLDGFIITGGQANGPFAVPCQRQCGGGLFIDNGGPTLANLTVSGNRAAQWGGGLYQIEGAASLSRAAFTANAAFDGAGLYFAQSGGSLTDLTLSHNQAAGDGGGLYAYESGSGLHLTNVAFRGNSASRGGGLYNLLSHPRLTNVSLHSNSAAAFGGGIYNLFSDPRLTNVTIGGNQAISGGGLFNQHNSNPLIENSIIWANAGGAIINQASLPTIAYSLTQGCNPAQSWNSGCGLDGGNNLADANPRFVSTPTPANAPALSGNLRLQANSPAVNVGDNSRNNTLIDLAGNERLVGAAIDLGAYEAPAVTCPAGGIRYVNPQATQPGDGASWASAYRDLQDGLRVTEACEVWVAAGIYYPADTPNDRSATFRLRSGVAIYGGFAGHETAREQRDWQRNPTILSGDIDRNDVNVNGVVVNAANIVGANSFNVVSASSVDNTAVLDGFIITGGQAVSPGNIIGGGFFGANSSPILTNLLFSGNRASNSGGGLVNFNGSPTLRQVTFSGNIAGTSGGGMRNSGSSVPVLTNVIFKGNQATNGGGLSSDNSNPLLINVIFTGNRAISQGGAIENRTNSPTLINVTLSGNSADSGGVIYNNGSSPAIRNTIIWQNNGGSLVNFDSTPTISYSLIQGCNPGGSWQSGCGVNGGNNRSDANPLFVAAPNPANAPSPLGNVRLQASSPAIGVGNNSFNSETADLVGNQRIIGGTIDLGAYETPSTACPAGGVRYVNAQATQPGDGLSWATGYRDLQDGLRVMAACEIWVAAGLYTPTDDRINRSATFQLRNNVAVYGGFAGGETARSQRDWQANPTILSGDIDWNDMTTNGVTVAATHIAGANSFHVVTASNVNNTAVLDGFTITGGQANSDGGGLYAVNGSPTLANLQFRGNLAANFGGGLYNAQGSPSLTNVTFSHNQTLNSDGGGMYHTDSGSPTLTDVTFSDNQAQTSGGGLANAFSGATLTRVTFSGNRALTGNGGGLFNESSSPTLRDVIFTANSAGQSGGGLHNISGSDPVLVNVLFSGNWAADFGGGLANFSNSNPTLTNVTMSGNHAQNGGGILNSGSSPVIRNAILWGNTPGSLTNFSASPTVSYSLVEGCNPGGSWNSSCGADGGDNLLDADPLLALPPEAADAPTTAGNLRLQTGSPAIDAGNDAFVTGVDSDLDGNPRIVGTAVDLGAYESAYDTLCAPFTADTPYTIGVADPVTITFTDPGDADCVTVTSFAADHPEATGAAVNVATGRYWYISVTGSGYTATLTLPHDGLVEPMACRWLEGAGPGAGWDCARSAFTAATVTRSNITQFSEWSVGSQVGPTAVTLASFSLYTAVPSGVTLGIGWLVVAALSLSLILLRPGRSRKMQNN